MIVESPAKAKTTENLGKGYKVEASQGHVRDLPKSQIGVDPSHDFAMKYITIRGRGDILARIRKEAKGADVIYLATDPDREEVRPFPGIWPMCWILIQRRNAASSFMRSPKAVKDAISHPRAIDMDRGCAAGAPRAGSSGGLQDQPAALGQDQEGPFRRSRAERSHPSGGGSGSVRSKPYPGKNTRDVTAT